MHITIKTIDEKTYTDYTQKHEQASFWQTPAMGKRRKHDGWTYELIGFYESEHLVGAALLFKRHILLGRYAYECYNGPILDYANAKNALTALKQYLIDHHVYSFQFNPNLTAYNHFPETNEKVEVNDYLNVKKEIEKAGFSFNRNSDHDENLLNWYYKKKLSDFNNEDELFQSFERETRRLINMSQDAFLEYEEVEVSDASRLKSLIDSTADTKHFNSRNLQYFETLYTEFKQEHDVKLVIITLNVKDYKASITSEIESIQAKINEDTEKNTKKSNNRAIQNQDVLKRLERQIDIVSDIKEDKVDVCGGLFLITPRTTTYLLGGSYNQYFTFNGPYFMQWEMMKQAYAKGNLEYDFYGTRGSFANRPAEDGVYNFKKGFNGQLVENFGYYHYDGQTLKDKLIRLLKNLRK